MREPRQGFAQAIGLVGVVENDDALRSCEMHPVPDTEVHADEHERSAARELKVCRADAPDEMGPGKAGSGLVFAPKPDIGHVGKRARRIERPAVRATVGVPQRIDEMHQRARHRVCQRIELNRF